MPVGFAVQALRRRYAVASAVAVGALTVATFMIQADAALSAAPTCRGLAATIVGTAGADTITGTTGDDVIVALEGNDTINGANGNDTICGDAGNDTIKGGNGVDTLSGGAGTDTLRGENGNDRAYGDDGDDNIDGAQGDDSLDGGPAVDRLTGGQGVDNCIAGETTLTCETSVPVAVAPTALIAPVGDESLVNGDVVTVTITSEPGAGVLTLKLGDVAVGSAATTGSGTYTVEINPSSLSSGGYLLTATIKDVLGQTASSPGVVVAVETEAQSGPTTSLAFTAPIPLSELGPLLRAANVHPTEYWHTIDPASAPTPSLPEEIVGMMAAESDEDHNAAYETEEINGGYIAGTTSLDDQLSSYQLAYEQEAPVAGEPQVFGVRIDGTHTVASLGELGQRVSNLETSSARQPVSGAALATTGSGVVRSSTARTAAGSFAAAAAPTDIPPGLDRAPWWPRYGSMRTFRAFESGNIVGTCFGGLPCRKQAIMLRAHINHTVTFKRTSLANFGIDAGFPFAYEHDFKIHENGANRSGTKPACKGKKRFYAQRTNAVAGSVYFTNWPKDAGWYVDWDELDSCTNEDLTLGVRYPERSYKPDGKTESSFYIRFNSPTSIDEFTQGNLWTMEPQSAERLSCGATDPVLSSGGCVGLNETATRGVLVATTDRPDPGDNYGLKPFYMPTGHGNTSCLNWSHRVTKIPPTPNVVTQGCPWDNQPTLAG